MYLKLLGTIPPRQDTYCAKQGEAKLRTAKLSKATQS